MRPLVIGIGNRWRRDDGLGPRVLDELSGRLPASVELMLLDGEPARLVSAWRGRPWVLVVDAVHAGEPPGTIHQLDGLSLVGETRPTASSHGAGLHAAVGLGRAIDQLPEALTVVGVEPGDVGHGDRMSDPVAGVFDQVLTIIEEEVRAKCA